MHTRRRSYHLWPKISKGNKEEKKRNGVPKRFFFAINISLLYITQCKIFVKKSVFTLFSLHFYRFVGSLALSIPAVVKSNETPAGPKRFRLILLFAGISCAGGSMFWALFGLPLPTTL
ncbi:hypothetical protein HNY73_002941 [Argiope bruennichi]|uniref:Uncharacterized protein n=1 Tax=Argiope bruennichi TaxID=94029 RepID=A0A8T0G1I7_ARGBR|nr:hypothetical protein HNY73_002941 [Argiope bruennichi]